MKNIIILLMSILVVAPSISQTKMFINKSSGGTDSLLLSEIQKISFKTSTVIGQDMVAVTGGTFQMGSNDANDINANPPHSVTLGSFYIEKYEVSYEKWTAVRTWGIAHGYTDLPTGQNGSQPVGADNPVTNINWYDMVKWCNARSEMDSLSPVYYTSTTFATLYRTGQIDLAVGAVKWEANGYRLPTEAEWEFAARGGTKTQNYKYSGSNTVGDVAWYFLNSNNSTHAVGQKLANELGLFDMSGNVYEECWDWSGAYTSDAQTNPKGVLSGSQKITRGGVFNDLSYLARYDVACRMTTYNGPRDRTSSIGFRCVQD